MADIQEFTEPPVDLTTEMMSPTTAALLAKMNASTIGATAGSHRCARAADVYADADNVSANCHDRNRHNNDVDSSSRIRKEAERMPLEPIQNNGNDGPAPEMTVRRIQNVKQQNDVTGPNETNYRTNHDSFVTKTIARYAARTSTNLRNDTLPNFDGMSLQERSSALEEVDRLLDRLTRSGGVGGRESSDGEEPSKFETQPPTAGIVDGNPGMRAAAFETARASRERLNETFGSATTLGEGGHDETFGSATTLGENNRSSATTLGNNKSLGSATVMGGYEEQSVSLLEDSMVLLSEEEEEVGGDDESRFSGGYEAFTRNDEEQQGFTSTAPIERTRHYEKNPINDDIPLESSTSSTPPFSTHKLKSKRCASNSGKRGFKSRHRSSAEEDDSLLGNFDGIGGSDEGGGMFLHDQEDAFSCGSPIQQRFSMDGLESDGSRNITNHVKRSNASNGSESDGNSRFSTGHDNNEDVSFNDGNDDNFEDDGSIAENRIETQRPNTLNQLSQWNTFRNADAELTYTQRDSEEENEGEESPVRRRAIRFDGASQSMHPQRRSQKQNNHRKGGKESSTTDGATEEDRSKKAGKSNDEDDDPVQTVRNLCRRAKNLEAQGVDSSHLEEVAPIDVRLRDGVHFRMDPLRCRQEKEKAKKSAFKRKTSRKKASKTVSIVHPGGKGGSKKLSDESLHDSENSLSDPEPSFKDPISDFPSRVAARLNAGLSYLMEKEAHAAAARRDTSEDESINKDQEKPSAVLLSMTIRQIMCVTSKLLLQTTRSTRRYQRSKNGTSLSSGRRRTPTANPAPPKGDAYLVGGTLVVLRGKEDIARWEVALREHTSLSCLDHAGMQSGLRKLANTAGKCAGFDVVLTTYDAIKSKEVTVPVDSSGCAILGSSSSSSEDGGGDGWFTARGSGNTQSDAGVSAPQKCHQLSVLHRMSWFRVIFMDVLGRKGFLTKPGTARAQAAVAINSKSRFAFFEKDEDVISKAEAKLKDDRRQLRSIMAALHLPERMKLDKLISSYTIDINQACKGNEASGIDLFSSSDEDISEDEFSV